MKIQDLIDSGLFDILNPGEETDRAVLDVFCCDLLSIAMSRGIEDAAWVTVMGNINTLAVTSLTDMACVILAEGASMDEAGLKKAKEEGITVLRTQEGIFPTALKIWNMLNRE